MCRKDTFYNPLLIIYTPLKRTMAPPSFFYFVLIFIHFVSYFFISDLSCRRQSSPASSDQTYHKRYNKQWNDDWRKKRKDSPDHCHHQHNNPNYSQDNKKFLPPGINTIHMNNRPPALLSVPIFLPSRLVCIFLLRIAPILYRLNNRPGKRPGVPQFLDYRCLASSLSHP